MTFLEEKELAKSHRWTDQLIDWLKTEHPQAYRAMKKDGTLTDWATEKVVRALNQVRSLMDQKLDLDQTEELAHEDLMSL